MSEYWKFRILSRFIGKTGHKFMRTVFTIKSTEDLKSKYKPGSDYYLGQTLSQLEATKRNLSN